MDQSGVQVIHNWAIDWDGVTYHRDDLTIRHARVVSELIGDDSWSWVELDPAGGPLTLLAVLVAFVSVDLDYDADEVQALIEELSAHRLTDLLEAFRPIDEVAA